MPEINIEDKKHVKEYNINKVCINLTELVFNKTASFMIDLQTTDGLADRFYYTLTDEEYNNWGNDDNYIITIILNKFGFIRKEIQQ